MTHGERRGAAALAGFSAVALVAAAYARFDVERPYRSVPHVRFSDAVLSEREARRDAARDSQAACNSASERLLGELKQNRTFYAYGAGTEGSRYSDAEAAALSELRLACEGAPLVPDAIYEPEVITVTSEDER